MKPQIIRWLTFLLSVVALIGFFVVYWKVLTTDWTQTTQPNPNLEFLASSLAGLVGGIVAAAFGQKLPDPPGSRSLLRRKLNAFGRFVSPFDQEPPRELLAIAYALIYISMSILAIVTWVADIPHTPKLTNHLAIVSLGLFIAIVTAYLNNPDEKRL